MLKTINRLNDEIINQLLTLNKFSVHDGKGLYLIKTEKQRNASWRFQYQLNHKIRTFTIGTINRITLHNARLQRDNLYKEVKRGIDVSELKKQTKIQFNQQQILKKYWSMNKLCDEFILYKILPNVKKPKQIISIINKEIKNVFGNIKAKEITHLQIDNLLQKIVKRNAPATAHLVLNLLVRIFKFARKKYEKTGVENNPADIFDSSDINYKIVHRNRFLNDNELKNFLQILNQETNNNNFPKLYTYAIKLYLLTAVRKMELLTAKWEDINLNNAIWKLKFNKTNQPIHIPLSNYAVELFNNIKTLNSNNSLCYSDYIFPNPNNIQTYLSADVILLHIRKKIMSKLSNVEPFTIHDLRRTARTKLAQLGIDNFVAERCLNHKLSGVLAIYNLHDYYEERKAALQLLADNIKFIENN